jgi:MoaD family protein
MEDLRLEMGVKIKIQKNLQFLTSDKETIEVQGSTVGECLDQLLKRFPEIESKLINKDKTLLNTIGVFVNGKSAYPNELTTPVKDGDEIFLFLLISGG